MQFYKWAVLAVLAVTAFTGAHATVSAATTTPPTYESEIAYTQTRPAFSPKRTINVTSGAALKTAVANLQAGDLVKATADFTLTDSSTSTLVINKRLASPAVIDLSGHVVKIVYTGTQRNPAVWVSNAKNVRIYGGDLSTSDTGGACILWFASQYVTWWGFKAHDCGADGVSMFTSRPGYSYAGPVEYNDVQGEVWKMGQHPAWDPHAEKCTGLHGMNLADGNYYPVDHNRIALYVHDSACEGAGIEFGSGQSTNLPDSNTIILKATNLSFVSKTQTGGNCIQMWGYGVRHTDIKYLECSNLTGHPYWSHGLNNKPNSYLSTDTVEYARASKVRLNPKYAQDPNYDKSGASVFQDVAPLP